MQLFSSKDKAFGCYITVTWILMSVSDIANAYGMIRGNFSERGEIIYSFHSESCVERGIEKEIYIKRINLLTDSGVDVNIVDFYGETFNSNYTDLIEKVAIDCNGRDECNSSYSGLRTPRPTLDGVPVDFIMINVLCFSASIDHSTVFNIGLDFGLKIPKSGGWYYLVLRLQNNTKTHRHCKIDGGRSYFWIMVLHVDFGPLPKCNKINSDLLHQCYGNMTLVSRVNRECNYTSQPPFTYRRIECHAEDVDIDVHMSTGFVWMELYAVSDIKLNCSGSNSYYDETSYSPTSGDPKIQDDLNNITTNYTDQTQTDERPSSSFHWTTTMDTVGDPEIQDDLNNITTHYTHQTQTDERPSSSFQWTTTTDTVATPRPKNCPQDVRVRSMGQDSVTFMWRHQAQYDDTEFRIAVFDNASNRIFAPNSPQVSDGAYTYISVTSLDHTTDYRFKIESTLSNVTEYVCDDELPKIVFCPEDSQEEVTFVQTRGGVTRQVPCPPNYEGNITRTCNHKTGSWTPFSQYNCARKRLIIASNLANDLSNESSEVLKARVKDISSEVTSALEGNITIVSGEIKQIVNILEQIGIASNRSSVSNDTLQRLAAITDKLIEADTSTWDELSSANKTENAGSVLLKAMEDITSSYLHSANVTDTLIQEKNIVITVASTGQGRDNITFPKMDQATYNTNQTLNKVFLSSEALSGSVAYSVIIYMNVSDKFKVHSSSNESSQEQRIGTDVISFSLSSKSTSLSSPLILTFKTGESQDGAVCSFLDTKNEISGVWLSDGCKTILKETTIDCQCSHLTNFAVLMSMNRLSPDHHTILSYISVIGLSISLFFLCLTVTVYSVMWRYVKSDRSVLHINLCVCLMLGYTVFLGGISRTEHRVACAVAAALLHYLFLAVFFVMLSQGLLILKSVTSVSSVSILRYLYIIMYGAPLVIVATSLGITQGEGFGTDKACWLSPQKGVLWAFVGPALSIVVVNFFILFAVIRIMQKSRIMTDKDVKKKTKSVVRSIFILSPILGVTWVLGVLSATMELAIFQYAFAISNSLQGLFIFIFQCVLQYQIKDGFRALLRRYRATSFDSSQRMVSTGQSQEKGYSESGQKTTSITNTNGSYMSKE